MHDDLYRRPGNFHAMKFLSFTFLHVYFRHLAKNFCGVHVQLELRAHTCEVSRQVQC